MLLPKSQVAKFVPPLSRKYTKQLLLEVVQVVIFAVTLHVEEAVITPAGIVRGEEVAYVIVPPDAVKAELLVKE